MDREWKTADPAEFPYLDAVSVKVADGIVVANTDANSWGVYVQLRQEVEGFNGLELLDTFGTEVEALRAGSGIVTGSSGRPPQG